MRGDDCVGLWGARTVGEMNGMLGGGGEGRLGGQSGDEGMGLRDAVALTAGEDETHRQAQAAHRHVDLAGQAATRAANGLILSPPFAPAACWCARTMVESMIRYSKSGSSARAAKMRCQTPLWLPRSKRRHTLFQLPKAEGRSRHGEPVRAIHRTPLDKHAIVLAPAAGVAPLAGAKRLNTCPLLMPQYQPNISRQDCLLRICSLESQIESAVNPLNVHRS